MRVCSAKKENPVRDDKSQFQMQDIGSNRKPDGSPEKFSDPFFSAVPHIPLAVFL